MLPLKGWMQAGRRQRRAAEKLYAAAMGQARNPDFYVNCGVSDSFDGRFDLLVLHVYLLLRRLKGDGRESAGLAQALVDLMMADMDQGLREMGVGDHSIGKRLKQLMRALYGRIGAYDAALDGTASLQEALARNLFRKAAPGPVSLAAMADYVRAADRGLADLSGPELLEGACKFPAAPELEGSLEVH